MPFPRQCLRLGCSLAQFVLGAMLAQASAPGTAHLLYDAVNRLDGVKMLALAVLAIAAATSGVLPRWLRYAGIALAITITASGVAYLLLLQIWRTWPSPPGAAAGLHHRHRHHARHLGPKDAPRRPSRPHSDG